MGELTFQNHLINTLCRCRHQEALEHARAAVILLEEEIEEVRDHFGAEDAPEVANKMAGLLSLPEPYTLHPTPSTLHAKH